ncbi:MarR family transcriptional regulator [Paenibacillus vini]|uniref:MarR family winged helix-turn-helix transcriptional regulator n=1 Tax=Paenibacillus vini TaxID=1476024 RepID=UPI0025B66541|nr:MarR family transcriptional regulator [Paenibacillus vini]MDN4068508.1 MarR family transcriptional regulator [Paenibacillus vini]
MNFTKGDGAVISRCNAELELMEEADWLFRRMVRRFVKERDKVEVEGISLPGLLVLQKMIREGPQRLGDLAEELDFTSGAVTGLCDKLERKGFALRIRRDSDRRSVWLDITTQGREFVSRNRNIGTRCIAILFEELSVEELGQVHDLFKGLIDRLEHFSDTLNSLAESNLRQPSVHSTGVRPEDTDEQTAGEEKRQGKYLSY